MDRTRANDRRRIRRIVSVLTAPVLAAGLFPHRSVRAEGEKYEIYAVRYATIANFAVSSLVAGADRARRLNIAMTLWVLKAGNGRIVLFDSGFHRDQYFKSFAVQDYVTPAEAIAPLGVKPEDVSDLIVSHMHWDHAGGLDLFPAARVWIQKAEYDYYCGDAWQARNTHGGIDPEDVLEIVKRNTQGKVAFVKGDDETTFPGISFGTGGKHTFESQFITVQTRSGSVVLASDNMYLYENLEKHAAIGQTRDAASNLRTMDRMRALAAAPSLVIPGHDPAVFDRFPRVNERTVRLN